MKIVRAREFWVKWGMVAILLLGMGCAQAKRELMATCACDGAEMTTRCEVGGKGQETEIKP